MDTADDLDASQGFNLWHAEYAKAERLQSRILSSGRSLWSRLKSLYGGGTVEVKRYWRCNIDE